MSSYGRRLQEPDAAGADGCAEPGRHQGATSRCTGSCSRLPADTLRRWRCPRSPGCSPSRLNQRHSRAPLSVVDRRSRAGCGRASAPAATAGLDARRGHAGERVRPLPARPRRDTGAPAIGPQPAQPEGVPAARRPRSRRLLTPGGPAGRYLVRKNPRTGNRRPRLCSNAGDVAALSHRITTESSGPTFGSYTCRVTNEPAVS